MFYLGGMTLGYFSLPTKSGKAVNTQDASALRDRRPDPAVENRERDIDFERAFMTPWHLFY